ncbi:DUF2812 domain-containing protein [Chloroflexota bacterium]
MKETTLRKIKLFLAWQDEKEEAWLQQMAQQGWHLSSVAPLVYTFVCGDPRDDVYRLDYLTSKADYEEYKQLFQDAGWELVGEMLSWQYFRKQASAGGSNEIYTDAESKVERYRRVLAYLLILQPVYVIWLVIDVPGPIKVVMALITVLWAFSAVRIFGRIRQLQHI